MKNVCLLGLLLLGGCLFVRDRVFEVKPDGSKVLVEDRVKVDPDNPVSSLPYGPIALSIMGLGAAAYNEWKKRDIAKQLQSTVRGIDDAGLDDEQIAKIRLCHREAHVEEKVKKVMNKVRGRV